VGRLDLSSAKKELKLADHMLYVTMPLIADERLFMSIIDHLFKSASGTIGKYLEREVSYKRIEVMPKDVKSQIELFKRRYVSKLGLNNKTVEMLDSLMSAKNARSNVQSNFARKDKFVMISRDYRVHTIDKDSIKRYISLQKELIRRIEAETHGGRGL
jgi:hypothetical protein